MAEMSTNHLAPGKRSYPKNRKHKLVIFILLGFLVVLLFAADIFSGSVLFSPGEIINALFNDKNGLIYQILTEFRIPKAVTAVMVGISLSVSGLQMQTLFRNPMAGPYVLGISSGASLGVALTVMGSSSGLFARVLGMPGNLTLTFAACAGAFGVMLLVYFISGRLRDIMTLLIIGIMLASGISAIVSVLQFFSSETMLKAYVIWTMGSLGNVDAGQLQILTLTTLAGTLTGIILIKPMNALNLGEDYASTLGLDVRRSKMMIFLSTSILTGSVTAFCGPIGFIGIAVPHIVRIVFRTSDNRVLVPAVILTGAIIMLFSDIVSQLPGSDSILPVNSVTAFIGIPVVIWIVLRTRRNVSFV